MDKIKELGDEKFISIAGVTPNVQRQALLVLLNHLQFVEL
jgi:hypothetical protein